MRRETTPARGRRRGDITPERLLPRVMGGQSAGLIHATTQIIVSDIDRVSGGAKIPMAQAEGCRNGSPSQRHFAPGGAALV
ncbi:MAG: hypothetical protein Q7N50_05880 [Armatimonadota bacterium]|nr:hypothetical protein [Armatimonadota bacterium]